MATHSRILAWENLWTEEPGGLCSPWARRRVGHNLATEQEQQSIHLNYVMESQLLELTVSFDLTPLFW